MSKKNYKYHSNRAFNDNAQLNTQMNDVQDNLLRKVILFTGDNGTSHAVINRLIPELLQVGIEPIILLTSGANSPKAKIQEIKDFSYFETGLLKSIYDYLDNSYPLTNEFGEPREDVYYSINQLTDLYGVHIDKISNVNDPILVASINNDASIIGSVSIKNYKIFSSKAIEALKENDKFLWNVHTGELPAYRGVFIPVRTMQDDNSEYGWTLHEIDNGIDTGSIIDIRTRRISDGASVLNAYFDMVEKGAAMIADNVKLAAKKMPRPPIPQDKDKARYFSFPTAEEIQELKDKDPPHYLYDEEETIERYVNMFSDSDNHPKHAEYLRKTLIGAIDDYKNGREVQIREHLYVKDKDSHYNNTINL